MNATIVSCRLDWSDGIYTSTKYHDPISFVSAAAIVTEEVGDTSGV